MVCHGLLDADHNPVATNRLDIYMQSLTLASIGPKRNIPIETTDIMLQMVASRHGVAALPRWLMEENTAEFDVAQVKLGRQGWPGRSSSASTNRMRKSNTRAPSSSWPTRIMSVQAERATPKDRQAWSRHVNKGLIAISI